MPNRSGTPVTIVASGGKPVTNVPGARPATPVASGGEPITLIPSGGMPMSLINADGSAWSDTPAVPVIDSVVISGTGKIGTVHTAVVSATSSLQATYAYQWRRNGVSISAVSTAEQFRASGAA